MRLTLILERRNGSVSKRSQLRGSVAVSVASPVEVLARRATLLALLYQFDVKARQLVALPGKVLATRDKLLAMRDNVLAMARNVLAMARNVLASHDKLLAMVRNVLAGHDKLLAMARNVLAMRDNVLAMRRKKLAASATSLYYCSASG
jgi:hypothetical protein